MGNKRHKPEEIVTKLRQVEVLVGQGMARIALLDRFIRLQLPCSTLGDAAST
ncbi:MAG: hypothetical protein HRT60_06745 [Dinoroseobacter sp.]|nr:hypothetical protein [Dinoroseobacter sp.]